VSGNAVSGTPGGVATVTLGEFLEARFAEEEAAHGSGRVITPASAPPHGDVTYSIVHGRVYAAPDCDITDQYLAWLESQPLSDGAQRVRAEVAVKRRIVQKWLRRWEEAEEATARGEHHLHRMYASQATGLGTAVRTILSLYADHPDFNEAWETE